MSLIWKSRLWKLHLATALQIVRCRIVVVLEVGGKSATRSACIAPTVGEPLTEQSACNPIRVWRDVRGLVAGQNLLGHCGLYITEKPLVAELTACSIKAP